jgi:hypothetical protein
MAKRQTINDNDRRDFVDNDEGLYDMWRRSGVGQYRWVRENRTMIDEVLKAVRDGARPAHFLKYGG